MNHTNNNIMINIMIVIIIKIYNNEGDIMTVDSIVDKDS